MSSQNLNEENLITFSVSDHMTKTEFQGKVDTAFDE